MNGCQWLIYEATLQSREQDVNLCQGIISSMTVREVRRNLNQGVLFWHICGKEVHLITFLTSPTHSGWCLLAPLDGREHWFNWLKPVKWLLSLPPGQKTEADAVCCCQYEPTGVHSWQAQGKRSHPWALSFYSSCHPWLIHWSKA